MASEAEIFLQLQRLIENMTSPHGIDFDKAYPEYVRALSKFSVAEIRETVDRVLAAEFGNRGSKAYPRVAELCEYVRLVRADQTERADKHHRKFALAVEREEAARIEEVFRNRTDEQRAVVAAAYDRFREGLSLQENNKLVEAKRERERERARIRAEFGMTPEKLATIEDAKLPKGMAPPHVDFRDHPVGAEKSTQPAEEELPW